MFPMKSEKLEWTDARELNGVRVQVTDAGGGSGVLWLRGEVSIASSIESVVKVLKDPLSRSDWDQTVNVLISVSGQPWHHPYPRL